MSIDKKDEDIQLEFQGKLCFTTLLGIAAERVPIAFDERGKIDIENAFN